MASSNISPLILSTLIAATTVSCSEECGIAYDIEPFEVEGRSIDPEAYASLITTTHEVGVEWADLNPAEKCAHACANVTGYLQNLHDGTEPWPRIDTCTLTLNFDQETFVDGELSCEGLTARYTCHERP